MREAPLEQQIENYQRTLDAAYERIDQLIKVLIAADYIERGMRGGGVSTTEEEWKAGRYNLKKAIQEYRKS